MGLGGTGQISGIMGEKVLVLIGADDRPAVA